MKHLLNPNVKKLQVPGIRKFSNMLIHYPDAVNLTIGQPDFDTPLHIKEAGKFAIDSNQTSYTLNAGMLELRQAVSEFQDKKYGLKYDPTDEIIITNGASEALDIALRTVLTEGSEVLLPSPLYPGYEPLIELCGAIPIYIDTSENHFKINAEMLERHLTEETRCLILPYPSNPLGVILNRKELQEIAEVIKDRDIFVITDEIYSELVYEGCHESLASIPSMRDKTIVINGLSKSHSMTGWRIGYTCAPSYITEEMVKVHLYNAICACTVSQHAALEALTHGFHDPEVMKKEYQMRRDYAYDRLTAMGLETVKPEGAFYLFPSIKTLGMKSFDFAMHLLETARVAVVPGDSFTEFGEGYIRISYAYSLEVLKEGLDRMERYIQTAKKTSTI